MKEKVGKVQKIEADPTTENDETVTTEKAADDQPADEKADKKKKKKKKSKKKGLGAFMENEAEANAFKAEEEE